MDISQLPGVLAALACTVAFLIDLFLIPPTHAWRGRLELLELPLVIAVSSVVAPGLFQADEPTIVFFCLAGFGMLVRFTVVTLRDSWNSGPTRQ